MLSRIKSFFLENTTPRQTVAKNTAWLAIGEIGSRLLRMVIVIYAARVLGVDGWGIFSYAITIAAFFTIFSDIGVNAILIREASRNPKTKDQYLSVSFFIKAVLLLISVAFVLFIAPLFTKIEAARALLPIVAFIIVFDGMREFGFAMNRALEKMEREAAVKLINNVSITVLGIALLTWVAPVPRILALSYLIGSAIGFSVMVWVLRKHVRNIFSAFNKKLVFPILAAAWPFALTSFFGALMLNIDVIMLGWWRTTYEIGWYAANQRIMQILYILPSFISISLLPTLARLAIQNRRQFRVVLEKALGVSYMVGIPLMVGGIILSKDIIFLLFGSAYTPGTLALQLLMLTLILMFGAHLVNNSIFTFNKQKNFIWLLASGGIVNTILNILLIPRYGIEGSAVATILSLVASYGIAWFVLKRINHFTLLPHLKYIIIATVIMGIGTVVMHSQDISILFNIPISALIYGAALLLFKEPLLSEVRKTISS